MLTLDEHGGTATRWQDDNYYMLQPFYPTLGNIRFQEFECSRRRHTSSPRGRIAAKRLRFLAIESASSTNVISAEAGIN